MSDQKRKAFEAFIAAAKAHGEGVTPLAGTEVIEDLRITLFARIIEWHNAGAWLPTEQHETVTEILRELKETGTDGLRSDRNSNARAWYEAGRPGLPKPPPETWGPELVSVAGRMPVGPTEVVRIADEEQAGGFWHGNAVTVDWEAPRVFQRKRSVADYELGRSETYEQGVTKLDFGEVIRMGSTGGPASLVYMSQVSNSPYEGVKPFTFRRNLELAK